MRAFFLSSLFLAVFILSSCYSFEEIQYKEISDIEVREISGEYILLHANAHFHNPNNRQVRLREAAVDVYFSEKVIAVLEPLEKVEIAAGADFTVPVRMKLDLKQLDIKGGFLGLFGLTELKLRFKGYFKVSTGILPFKVKVDEESVIRLR